MLSSKKSIFHVGEEGGDHNTAIRIHAKKILAHRIIKGAVVGHVRSPVEGHVGLRIVIQQHIHGSNIVLKPMVNPCKFKELLKACYLCKKVLRPNMDVYMYRLLGSLVINYVKVRMKPNYIQVRGDLGFCSEECRCQQILRDEQIEATSKRKRLGLTHQRHQQANKSNIKPTNQHKKILLMA